MSGRTNDSWQTFKTFWAMCWHYYPRTNVKYRFRNRCTTGERQNLCLFPKNSPFVQSTMILLQSENGPYPTTVAAASLKLYVWPSCRPPIEKDKFPAKIILRSTRSVLCGLYSTEYCKTTPRRNDFSIGRRVTLTSPGFMLDRKNAGLLRGSEMKERDKTHFNCTMLHSMLVIKQLY